MDASLQPPSSLPSPPAYVAAPSDIYPRGRREVELCAKASRPDLLYIGGLLLLDAAAIGYGASSDVKYSDSVAVRALVGPGMIGATWGATISGTWLSLPKCEPHWVGESPREGAVREVWPLAFSLALLAGATAPIVNAIAIGYNLPVAWSTPEREVHIIIAGLAGFGGALVPFVLPPRTWAAAKELDRIRFGYDGRSGYVGYAGSF